MVTEMRVAAVLLSGFFAFAAQPAPQVAKVRTVYLLPMSGNLDQYLANRLTSSGTFQVVTDPQKADAIFTDRLGDAFHARLLEFYPDPPAAKAEEKPVKEEKEEKEEKVQAVVPAVPDEAATPRTMAFARGKGNIFLVDGRTRTVLWSYYEETRSNRPAALNTLAGHIVDKLKNDVKSK